MLQANFFAGSAGIGRKLAVYKRTVFFTFGGAGLANNGTKTQHIG